MKRRKFLQNILKVTAIASVPAVVINELVKKDIPTINIKLEERTIESKIVTLDGGWSCDEETKLIIQNGGWKDTEYFTTSPLVYETSDGKLIYRTFGKDYKS